jgi:hypothetical protein
MIVKIYKISVLLMIVGSFEMQSNAQSSFCAVKLSAESINGLPVQSAFAELIDPSGKIIQRREIVKGQADFCDFGFGYHAILIRGKTDDDCQTIVKNVKVVYGLSQQIKVILHSCLEYRISDMANACFIYLRVSSLAGEQLQGVNIHRDNGQPLFTDEYGRARIGIPVFSAKDVAFSKNGFETQKVHIECQYTPVEKDMTIEMRPVNK